MYTYNVIIKFIIAVVKSEILKNTEQYIFHIFTIGSKGIDNVIILANCIVLIRLYLLSLGYLFLRQL
jgi:hypothetical protein